MIRDLAKGFTMHAAETLCKDASYIPEEKLCSCPEISGKSVIVILDEIVKGNYKIAAAFRGEDYQEKIGETDLEKLKGLVISSAEEVCKAIDSLTDEQLAGLIKMPWGQEFPGAAAIFLPSSHMNYHDGQINYIQLLLGDTKFHWLEG